LVVELAVRLHPRHAIVNVAGNELFEFVRELIERHGLTHGEVTALLAASVSARASYQIRDERRRGASSKRGKK
jgi:hypothetical protein